MQHSLPVVFPAGRLQRLCYCCSRAIDWELLTGFGRSPANLTLTGLARYKRTVASLRTGWCAAIGRARERVMPW